MSEFQIYGSSNSLQRGAGKDLSPHRYDADFYRRKSDRLEEELLTLTDQLNKARLRLRKAQDFEIKCQLLYKQNLQFEENAARKEKELFQLRAENEQMRLKLEQKGVKNDQNLYEKQRILRQIQVWKSKCLQAEQRCKLIAAEEQLKNEERIRRDVATNKRNFDEKEKEYKYEIQRLKKQLKEKMIVDHTSHQKIDKIKKEKEDQIKRLEELVAHNREEYMAMVTQKNQQILNQKTHFEVLMNEALGKLKTNLNHQDDKFKIQLSGLSNVIKIKNQEITKLQNELRELVETNNREREQLNKQIRMLKDKIYQLQLAHDQEIVNLKERLTTLHAIDITANQEHYQKLLEAIKDQRTQLEQLLSRKEKENAEERTQSDKQKAQLQQTIAEKNRMIDQLSSRFSSSQTSNSVEVSNLQQALATVANQKQQLTNEYQSNVTFLNQQINKLTLSNQLKNNEIKQLHQYNALLKRQQFQQIRQLEQKWKQERKDRETERQKERDLREKVEQDFREQEKIWKNRERELEKEIQKERREKNKLAGSLQSSQKQVQRLFKENIMLEQRCKKQQGKNQRSILTGGGAKRELQNELIRQKSELQAIKRMQIDQFKKESELQLTRLRNSNQRLQNELTSKKIDYENLQNQFKKISSQYKNIDKINKQKLVDYQKKIATLNSEILLTQNLYQNLITAKSKVVKEEKL